MERKRYFTKADLKLFTVCNSSPNTWKYKKSFYEFKDKMLIERGEYLGYDLQMHGQECFTCKGKGKLKILSGYVECGNCVNGFKQVSSMLLQRWNLKGQVFHLPEGALLKAWGKKGKRKSRFTREAPEFVEIYNGLINHDPVVGYNATRSFFALLYKFDKDRFYSEIASFYNTLSDGYKGIWYNVLKESDNISEGVDNFLAVKYKLPIKFKRTPAKAIGAAPQV